MQRNDAIADLAFLKLALEERFSYLRANDVDVTALFGDLLTRLPEEFETDRFGLDLQQLLAHFIDGHAAVNARPSPLGFMPFLTGSIRELLVAFQPDRSGLLDPERPFVAAIDEVPIQEWLTAAARYVAAGSPQLVRRESLRWLRAVQLLRRDLGLPENRNVDVVLTTEDGSSVRTLSLEVLEQAPQFDIWPRTESQVLEGDVAYLRLPRMRPEAADDVERRLERSQSNTGLIVDVRGNGGGSRDALLAMMPALMAEGNPPRVVNVAAYRSWSGFPDDHLAARHLFPVSSERWSPRERAALDEFMATFTPEWQPPLDEFSTWHAMVVSPAAADAPRFLERPVVVLMDSRCFSATDVFLSALKGLPNVTLVGEPSGGGSARAQVIELPSSGLKVRFASMASYQASGELFDGRGVQPDVLIGPEPEHFVVGGRDVVLERGLELVT